MNCIDVINRKIKNVDEKIFFCIEDYKIVGDINRTANGILQYLRTLVEHVAARIYAEDYPAKNIYIGNESVIWFRLNLFMLKTTNQKVFIE